ncbi:alpha/beta fold hydrolase [Microbacterium sp. 18062]|uniref:alpha/beta fold hydrolase n=1 Tax=Microbacterium sp. 18062 TaxID=2681410 RepID=UPI00135A3CDC|nr:alpha/beta fold hydrolase [Microbacterium sp. 18062]
MTLPYEWSGTEGRPVLVLVNSLGTSRAMWSSAIAELQDDYRILSSELPGHIGASRPFSFGSVVDRTLELLEETGVSAATMAGVSLGGSIAVVVGARRPDLVGRVVAVNAPIRQESPEFWLARADRVLSQGMGAIAEGAWERWFPERTASAQAVVDTLASLDPTGYAEACRAIADLDIADEARVLDVPALIVAADDDASVPPSNSVALAAAIDDSTLWRVGVGGHLLPVRRPRLFAQLVDAFVRSREI